MGDLDRYKFYDSNIYKFKNSSNKLEKIHRYGKDKISPLLSLRNSPNFGLNAEMPVKQEISR